MPGPRPRRSRKRVDELGALQQRVMDALWDDGPGTVEHVRLRLGGEHAYTTILTVLQKLEKAGWVRHSRDGRAFVYAAARTRDHESRRSLLALVDGVFGGDRRAALLGLLEDESLSDADLDELEALIARRRQEKRDA